MGKGSVNKQGQEGKKEDINKRIIDQCHHGVGRNAIGRSPNYIHILRLLNAHAAPIHQAHHYIHPFRATSHITNRECQEWKKKITKKNITRMCLPSSLSFRLPSPSHSSSIRVSSPSPSGIRPSSITELLCPKGCESG